MVRSPELKKLKINYKRRKVMKYFILIVSFILVNYTLGLTTQTLQAQPYPTHPIQLVISAGPGDASDITARLLIEELGKILNTPGRGPEQAGRRIYLRR